MPIPNESLPPFEFLTLTQLGTVFDVSAVAAGHMPVGEEEQEEVTPTLHGPFEARRSDQDGDGFEVVDSEGVVGIWVRGEDVAGRVVRLLNLAHECGKF